MENYIEKTDEKLKRINEVLKGMDISAPEKINPAWIYVCMMIVIVAAFVILGLINIYTDIKFWYNNNTLIYLIFCAGLVGAVSYFVIKACLRVHTITTEQYNKEFDSFDFYRKALLERYLKEEDKMRKESKEEAANNQNPVQPAADNQSGK